MRTRKQWIYVFVPLFCIFLTSCFSTQLFDTKLKSTIVPKQLTADQQSLVELLPNNARMFFFTYKTEKAYQERGFWLDVYQYGERTESYPAGVYVVSNEMQAKSGEVMVLMTTYESTDQWIFTLREGERMISNMGQFTRTEETNGMLNSIIQDPVSIEDGEECVLAIIVFTNTGAIGASVTEYNMDELKKYPYVYVIKARLQNPIG